MAGDTHFIRPTTVLTGPQGRTMWWRATFAIHVDGDLGVSIDFPQEWVGEEGLRVTRVTLEATSIKTVRTSPAAIDCGASIDLLDTNGVVLNQDVSSPWLQTRTATDNNTFRCEFQPANLLVRFDQALMFRCPEMDIHSSPTAVYGLSIVTEKLN